jgi:dTDP-glucose 4,6-dehydratase
VFEAGLAQTVRWYRDNRGWIDRVRSGEYREYYEKNYGWRATGVAAAAG